MIFKAPGSGANDVKSAASDAEAGIDSSYKVIADSDAASDTDKPESKEENN